MAEMNKGWLIRGGEDDTLHIMPFNDLRAHFDDDDCWCGVESDGHIRIHTSLDRREEHELN